MIAKTLALGLCPILLAGQLSVAPVRAQDEPMGDRPNRFIHERNELEVPAGRPAAVLPEDTMVRITLAETLNSRNFREGDHFRFTVARDVLAEGVRFISASSEGTGTISGSRRAGGFGRSGKLELSFGSLHTPRGDIPLTLSRHASEMNEREGLAAGASLAGLAALGPVGLVGGLFVKGKDVVIPAGSERYVATETRFEWRERDAHD